MRMLLFSAIVFVISAISLARPYPLAAQENLKSKSKPSPATAHPASWQSKWGDFVAEFNSCMASRACDPASRFYGKVVSWQGMVEKVGNVISIKMGSLRLTDRQGKASDFLTVLLFPAKDRGDTWNHATVGSTVAFRGRLPARGSELGAVELNSLGNKNFAFVQLVDAEILTPAIPPK